MGSCVNFSTQRYSGFNPRTIPGCVMWLDAADGSTITLSGSSVTVWNDKSGKANNMTYYSTYDNATVSANYQNNLNVLNFSGSNLYSAPSGSGVYPLDAYLVIALKSDTEHYDILSLNSNNTTDNFNCFEIGEYTTSRWHNGSSGFSRTPNTVFC